MFRAALLVSLAFVATTAAAADPAALTAETRDAVKPLLGKVLGTLQQSLNASTPHDTIDACRDKLPGLVKETREKTGWNIRRVSLKPRNAERATPDAFEQRVLADFDKRAAAGEKPETLEFGEIVSTAEGRVFRYMKALPVQEVCMNCHGDSAAFSADLKAKLASLYPADQATGYALGQLRGALTVKRALPAN